MAKQQIQAPQDASDEVVDASDLNSATVTISFRGETFAVPKRRGRWPIESILQFGRGQGLLAVRALFADTDWDRLKKICPTGDDFDAFIHTAIDTLTTECVL